MVSGKSAMKGRLPLEEDILTRQLRPSKEEREFIAGIARPAGSRHQRKRESGRDGSGFDCPEHMGPGRPGS